MSPGEIVEALSRGKRQGCKEALMCLGDKPELAYSGYRATLAGFGHQNTTEDIYRAELAARGMYCIPPYCQLPAIDPERPGDAENPDVAA